jgi:hypothetical protein
MHKALLSVLDQLPNRGTIATMAGDIDGAYRSLVAAVGTT